LVTARCPVRVGASFDAGARNELSQFGHLRGAEIV
jgi:hypothetical protein